MVTTHVLSPYLGTDKQLEHLADHVTGVFQTIAETDRIAGAQVAASRSGARFA